jgi:hypothetical protein
MGELRVLVGLSFVLGGCQNQPPSIQDAPTIEAGVEAGADVAQPIDATPMPKGGGDAACNAPLGWWATGAAFDSTITPTSFSSAVNPLLSGENPFTIADYVDATMTWTVRASGTLTNGGYQQYFPPAYPADTSAMARTTSAFSSGVAASSWIVVVDAASNYVWIPLANAQVAASYGDTYCQSLVGGTLDAVIPASAGSTSITTSTGATTLQLLLGATTSISPVGWTVHVDYDGQKVDVSSK